VDSVFGVRFHDSRPCFWFPLRFLPLFLALSGPPPPVARPLPSRPNSVVLLAAFRFLRMATLQLSTFESSATIFLEFPADPFGPLSTEDPRGIQPCFLRTAFLYCRLVRHASMLRYTPSISYPFSTRFFWWFFFHLWSCSISLLVARRTCPGRLGVRPETGNPRRREPPTTFLQYDSPLPKFPRLGCLSPFPPFRSPPPLKLASRTVCRERLFS